MQGYRREELEGFRGEMTLDFWAWPGKCLLEFRGLTWWGVCLRGEVAMGHRVEGLATPFSDPAVCPQSVPASLSLFYL